MNGLFNKAGINSLSYAISTLTEKNKQIARNISNADTPMYRATKLDFKEVMQEYYSQSDGQTRKLYSTNSRHMQPTSSMQDPESFVRRQNNPSTRTDGNDVNLDYEMSEQAAATIMYNTLTTITGNKFASLKEVMRTR